MLLIVRWFISNYYKRPRGLKKPYNPLLGEVYRCMYVVPAGFGLPETQCFVVAEQVRADSFICFCITLALLL